MNMSPNKSTSKSSKGSKYTFQVWSSGHNLASINSDCLAVMAFLKLVCPADCVAIDYIDSPHNASYNPFSVSFHSFPRLKISENVKDMYGEHVFTERYVSGVFNIMDEMRKVGSEDSKLNKRQGADVLAFTSMIQRNLVPALNYLWWVDDKSYDHYTLPWFTSRLPFVIRSAWLSAQRNKHRQALSIVDSSVKSFNKEKIFENAANCLKVLSDKLNGKKYFFNDSFCTLDAIVYGCLALLEHIPFDNDLVKCYRGHSSLVASCRLVDKSMQGYIINTEPAKIPVLTTTDNFSKKKMALFAFFSISALITYALTSGLIQIDFDDQNEDVDFNEFDDPEINEPPPDDSEE